MNANHVLNAKIKSTVHIQTIYRAHHLANQCADLLLRIGRFISLEKQSDSVSLKLIEQSILLAESASHFITQCDASQQLEWCSRIQKICVESNSILDLCIRCGMIKKFDVQELKETLSELIAFTKTIESQIKFKQS